MTNNLIARQSIKINGSVEKVWDALINPSTVRQYMFGTTITSDWKEGSAITWSGEWEGKHYEDKGKVIQVKPHKLLEYTHFSPLSGLPDKPENYHKVTVELAAEDSGVRISLSQDNNSTEEAKKHSEKNWAMVLEGLKKCVEG